MTCRLLLTTHHGTGHVPAGRWGGWAPSQASSHPQGSATIPSMKHGDPCFQPPLPSPDVQRQPHTGWGSLQQLPTHPCPMLRAAVPRLGALPKDAPCSWLQAVSGSSTPSSAAGLAVAMPCGVGAVSRVSLQCGVRRVPAASPASSERMARSPHSIPSCYKAQHSRVSPGQGPHTRDEAP